MASHASIIQSASFSEAAGNAPSSTSNARRVAPAQRSDVAEAGRHHAGALLGDELDDLRRAGPHALTRDLVRSVQDQADRIPEQRLVPVEDLPRKLLAERRRQRALVVLQTDEQVHGTSGACESIQQDILARAELDAPASQGASITQRMA